MFVLRFLALAAAITLVACDSSDSTPAEDQSLAFQVTGFSPARTGEVYALWLAFPEARIAPSGEPQHGEIEYQLVSTFDISSTGIPKDFTATIDGLPDLALALQALVSVEKRDSVGDAPRIPFLAGEITGTATQGTATLTAGHHDAVSYSFASLAASATLASPDSAAADFPGELYLMNASNASNAVPSVTGLVPLGAEWRYGLWVVDSATRSLPPFNIFYGFVTGAAETDSDPNNNRFNFPGGRYPATSTEPVYTLNSGTVTVMITLEPHLGEQLPLVPFGGLLLETVIPKDQPAFTPFTLANRSLTLPQASLILNR